MKKLVHGNYPTLSFTSEDDEIVVFLDGRYYSEYSFMAIKPDSDEDGVVPNSMLVRIHLLKKIPTSEDVLRAKKIQMEMVLMTVMMTLSKNKFCFYS